MSDFVAKIQDLCKGSNGFETFRKGLTPEVVAEACAAEGLPVGRNRRLPRISIIWLTVGMALFRNESIQNVAKCLNLGLGVVPRSSSISEARDRLGSNPLRWLFQRLGSLWNTELESEKVRGLTVYGIDGSVVTLEDTKANVEAYGKPGSRKDKSGAARPQARTVGLMDLTTKILVDGEIVPLRKGENTALKPLIDRIPGDSISIVDRGFQSKTNFALLAKPAINRHFLARVKSTFKARWVRDVSRASWIGELAFTAAERKENPDLPETLQVRVVEYRIDGHRDVIRIATSHLDEQEFPAIEVARLYGLRWEYELGLRDLKSTLLQKKTHLRSKKPDGVLQEIYGIFLAYNLVRHEMGVVANYYGTAPQRLSFKTALSAVNRFFTVFSSGYADFACIPEAVDDMRKWIWHEQLPERDPFRVCPRWVKSKQPSKFPRKPSSPTGV